MVDKSLNSVRFGHYYLPFYIFCQDCSLWLIIYMTPQALNFDLYWPYINDPQDPPSHVGGTAQKLAQNRQEWGTFVVALHASWHNGLE